ncbi:ABC transporter substrate-binding protein [Natrinema altunense]|uniref:Family 5 extracellular solute-binding protein n=1 Tax=Natrinema altunense (strain JCM 12890 / CGMCC 1.3731 / AJ2) TaxID=1227494 RepID=L9ZDI6_NATA2|nr:ABC transporter substrate-binding protein [Natrinema altunense]ELY84530.1 family 5 extracellular solute-binding protein [Natrinema altunense JCM 12890]
MSNHTSELSRRRLLASGTAVSAAAIAGCIGGSSSDGEAFHYTQEQSREDQYDPIVSNDTYSFQVIERVFDGLYEYGEGLELQPRIAKGEPTVERDGTRYIFEIKEAATFHNGDDVTAADVAHSFTAPVEETTENAAEYNMIESTEVIDDTQLQVDLGDDPYGPFELTTMGVLVVPKDVRTDDRDKFNRDPIGAGPFKFSELGDTYVEVEKWDDYWGDLEPNVERVRFEAHDDNAGRVSSIRSGDTDVISEVPNKDWDVLKNEDGINLHSSKSSTYMYMAFNCNEGPTTNPEVRRAIAHSFSMQSFIESNAGNVTTPMYSPIPPVVNDVWEFPEEEYRDMLPEYDPDQAKSLLDEHAPDDFEPTILTPSGLRAQLAERIATRLDSIGYGADVQQLNFAALLDKYHTGNADDYQMYLLGWSGGGDPDDYLYALFHESQTGATGNQGHYYEGSDSFHDDLLRARNMADRDERYEIYDPIIREIVEQLPVLPAFTLDNTMASRDYVNDLQAHPDSATNPVFVSDYANVSIE